MKMMRFESSQLDRSYSINLMFRIASPYLGKLNWFQILMHQWWQVEEVVASVVSRHVTMASGRPRGFCMATVTDLCTINCARGGFLCCPTC